MQASNNSPLPKGDLNNQELKTKGTIWKPLIAVSLLSVFSFTAGQYLPYVIAAVSGSGVIAAVPLAIFAVSTVIALVSAIYLIKLVISGASNKKEAGLSREESDQQHTKCQEPTHGTNLESKPIGEELIKQDSGSQTEARGSEHVDNDTNLENKSSMPTPPQSPLTLGTAIPQGPLIGGDPPPPPLPSSAPPPPPPPPPFPQGAPPLPPQLPSVRSNLRMMHRRRLVILRMIMIVLLCLNR